MDRSDQQAIEDLFERLEEVERRGSARDRDAEDFIARQVRRQPGAPYYMAQTIVMQQRALERLQARVAELEGEEREEGGLFGGLFGGRSRRRGGDRDHESSVPRYARGGSGGGGGFLAGAAQTAVGVAGGVLLGNALAGMFGGGDARAAESGADDPGADENGADDGGDFDSGDFGGDLDI